MSVDIFIVKNFINEFVCSELNSWAEQGVKNKWLDRGISRGSNWSYEKRLTTRNYADRFEYPEIVYDVFDGITKKLDVTDLFKSVTGGGKDGVVVSYTIAGGDTYAHVDPKEGRLEVLRCNILTRKPTDGGVLFVGGKQVDLDVGDLHCYLPSTVEHYVTETRGNVPRILWMFGYQCTVGRFKEIRDNYETDHRG